MEKLINSLFNGLNGFLKNETKSTEVSQLQLVDALDFSDIKSSEWYATLKRINQNAKLFEVSINDKQNRHTEDSKKERASLINQIAEDIYKVGMDVFGSSESVDNIKTEITINGTTMILMSNLFLRSPRVFMTKVVFGVLNHIKDNLKSDLDYARKAYDEINELMRDNANRSYFSYTIMPSFDFMLQLRDTIKDKKILSIGSGSAYFEFWMSVLGLDVKCTDDNSFTIYVKLMDVENIDAKDALEKYKDYDVIFTSWLPQDHHKPKNDPGLSIMKFLSENRDKSYLSIDGFVDNNNGTNTIASGTNDYWTEMANNDYMSFNTLIKVTNDVNASNMIVYGTLIKQLMNNNNKN